jgi:5-methylcytosine-specific restriction endonuclease McrA
MTAFSRYSRRPHPTMDELRTAVAQSVSLADVLRCLNRPVNGSQQAQLRRRVTEAGLSTSHFLGRGRQRGKRSANSKRPEEVLVLHSRTRRTTTKLLRHALFKIGVPEQCARCGIGPEGHGRPMTLEVDHISGDSRDDRQENLRLLCPNCHAITSTWCRGGNRRRRPARHG